MYPSLDMVVGHAAPRERFHRTLASGRLASTYLFVGPEGVGKRTFAQALARPLLCRSPGPAPLDACGECASCRMLEAGSHPDLLKTGKPEGKSTLPLEAFIGPPDKRHKEGLCHDLALRPMVGDRRVAIIDDADALSIESANALLKTLEEPPPRSVLILIGTALARQLPTIRSRCQVVRFGELSAESVAKLLASGPYGLSEDESQQLANGSRGSMSEALVAAGGDADFDSDAVQALFSAGEFNPGRFSTVIDEVVKSAGSAPAEKRRRMQLLVRIGVDHWRRQLAGERSVTALDSLDALIDAEEAIHRNANQVAVTQALVGRLWRASQRG